MSWVTKDEDKTSQFQEDRGGGRTLPLKSVECENSAEEDTLARAIEQGDANALAAALKNGQVQVKKRA
jgi:hypothetical protein